MVKRLAASNKRAYTTLAVCGLLFALSLCAAGFALIDRFNQTDDRRLFQAKINQQILKQTQANKETVVDLLCFVRTFSLGDTRQDPKGAVRFEAFIKGALISIHASPTACLSRPGNPN